MPRNRYEHVAGAIKYARSVASHRRVAGEYTILACERFLNDLETKGASWEFDPNRGNRVCRFIEHLPHVKGRWAREQLTITLEPWMQWWLVNLFGFVDKETRYRRFVEGYIRVARKNAKSTLAAGVGIYMLTEDDEFGAEIYSGATSQKQALEVFRPAKQMCERLEPLREGYGIEVNATNLIIPDDGSKMEPIIGNPGDGSSPSCALIDEFHEHRTGDLYETMLTGMGAREQPLALIITTAGITTDGPCFEKDDEIKKVLRGTVKDDSLFGVIYAADEGDDWKSITAMKKANPNLDVSVSKDYLKTRLQAAKRSPAQMAAYQTKHLNWWVGAGVTFLNVLKWNQNAQKFGVDELKGKRLVYGVDLSSRVDITAVVRVGWEFNEDGNREYYVVPAFFIPEAQVIEDKSGRYASWVKDGWLNMHPDEEIDYAILRQWIMDDAAKLEPEEIAYDPWKSAGIEQELSSEGFTMVRLPQTVGNFTSPMDELEAANESGRIHHDNNPVMNWMISNLTAKVSPTNGTKKPHKEIAKNKIDGPVGLLMGINRALVNEAKPISPWEDPAYSMGE